jgi:hypothetical protein
MSEGRRCSTHIAITDEEQEVVNIYYINENNLYACTHVQLDINGETLIAVLDTEAEISLMPEKIFVDLVAKGLRAPQLPLVKRALLNVFGSKTKRVKRQALTFIIRRTDSGAVFLSAHATKTPVRLRCGHLNAQYTHAEA